jgi:hypothetical protein
MLPTWLRDGLRAVDPFPAPVQHVGRAHRRLHIPMAKEFLNCADVIAIFQQIRGEQVPWCMAADRLGQAGLSGRFFDGPLSDRFVHMMPPVLPGPRVQADL